MKKYFIICLAWFFCLTTYSQAISINHTCTKVSGIPESAIAEAKQSLHIAYGHTSHGSQLTDGMTGLVAFMNGLGYPEDLFAWNNGGTDGTLDLHDYAMGGDVGYYPDWVNNTRSYLGEPDPFTGRGTGENADVNVIIWSWCGQVDDKYAAGTLFSEYIDPMVELEADYFGVKFIYMTGHLDHYDDANNKAANQVIRDFCQANNKILYDFADIESYDPDSNYYQYAGDDCSYYSADGQLLGNWAIEWQDSHTVDVDWYQCGAAHTQPLNANQKAYASWWMWARLAGWDPSITGITNMESSKQEISILPNPANEQIFIKSASEITRVKVCNIAGTEVFSKDFNDRNVKLSTSVLKPGVYVVDVMTGNGKRVGKVVVR